MTNESTNEAVHAVFLATCPDQKGIVASLSGFIFEHGGNVVDSDQHCDLDAGIFAIRVEWELRDFKLKRNEIAKKLAPITERFQMDWTLQFTDKRPKIAIWVTKQEHCLIDLLGRYRAGDIRGDVALVLSNHEQLRWVADQFGIAFHCFPIDAHNKGDQERMELQLMKDEGIDLIVLAKYMQVLSGDLVANLPPIINIHHSFLPAFAGASPYHRAFKRGVKIIGATAHFVTKDLDEGPIVEQDVCTVTHRDDVRDMIRKGKDLEKIVLSRAVYLQLEQRILVYGNKTLIFK